jgi:hypothetical protein
MLSEMTWAQLVEWQVYASVDPFEEVRADIRAALIAATIANVHRGKGKPAFTVKDFLLQFEKAADGTQSVEAIKQMLTAFTAQWNASQKRHRQPDG